MTRTFFNEEMRQMKNTVLTGGKTGRNFLILPKLATQS